MMGFFTPGRMMKFGVALLFDLLKFIFSLAFLFAPLIAGVALGALAQSKCSGVLPDWTPGKGWVCSATGAVVGTAVTTGGYVLEATGVGFVAIEGAGEVLADATDFMAWLVFLLWFAMTGVKFFGGQRASGRFIAMMASSVGGVIPFLNVAPTITIGVVAVEYQHWLEIRAQELVRPPAPTRAARIAAQQGA
ncbi:MAG TPA: hypothetical protein VF439_00960 [Candidatus Paceibacterota bacterium]